jgi:peroxiredoxin
MNKMLIPSLLLSLLLFALPALAVEPGTPAPDFTLKTLDGTSVSLSDYRGQPIILKLATTWCPTCKQQSEAIRAVGDFLAQHDVAVVEVFLQDSEQMVRDYLEGVEFPMPHVALLDDGSALRAYNVYLIPRTVLIDPSFTVRRDGSLLESKELVKEVEKILPGEQ